MSKEEKELLLKDLCARLSYGVICQFIWTYSDETTDGKSVIAKEDDNIRCIDIHSKEIQSYYYGEWVDLEHCKPYLRPISSMTEEERAERTELLWELEGHIDEDVTYKYQDWLNAHHLDYRGLIPKGLALEVPVGMYKEKN